MNKLFPKPRPMPIGAEAQEELRAAQGAINKSKPSSAAAALRKPAFGSSEISRQSRPAQGSRAGRTSAVSASARPTPIHLLPRAPCRAESDRSNTAGTRAVASGSVSRRVVPKSA